MWRKKKSVRNSGQAINTAPTRTLQVNFKILQKKGKQTLLSRINIILLVSFFSHGLKIVQFKGL